MEGRRSGSPRGSKRSAKYEKRYHVIFKPRDVACIPPCGMEATLQSHEEMVRSILSRYADASTGEKPRFGRSEVEIRNGLVIVESEDETDVAKVLARYRGITFGFSKQRMTRLSGTLVTVDEELKKKAGDSIIPFEALKIP